MENRSITNKLGIIKGCLMQLGIVDKKYWHIDHPKKSKASKNTDIEPIFGVFKLFCNFNSNQHQQLIEVRSMDGYHQGLQGDEFFK